MRWMVQRTKLDSDQDEILTRHIRKGSGNIWLKGHAGSGKSILIAHGINDALITDKTLKVGVVVFTRALVDLFQIGIAELGTEKTLGVKVPVMTYSEFKKSLYGSDQRPYDIIFCDEVQDLPAAMIMLLKSNSKRLVVAGDSQQSIYSTDPSTNEPVIRPEQIGTTVGGAEHELPTIYRLSRSIIKLVDKLLGGSILNARRDATKIDSQVQLGHTDDFSQEIRYVWQKSSKQAAEGYSTVILMPYRASIADFCNEVLALNNKPVWAITLDHYGKNEDFAAMNRHLLLYGIQLEYIGNGVGSLASIDINHRVAIMTYHSSKGLDFQNVYLPWVAASQHLSGNGKDKTLFMVAMTRSRLNLVLTYCGTRSSLVDAVASDCKLFEIVDATTAPAQPQAPTYDF